MTGYEDSEPRGARILSLDDGGIRCLSTLFILINLMEKVKERLHLEVAPRPWQHFDLICGTGFGGILALMLGRLRMSIPQCQLWFVKSSSLIFEQRQTWVNTWTMPTPEERSRTLNKTLESLLASTCPDIDCKCTLESGTCNKTFVLSMYAGNMRVPARLRTYSSRMDSASRDMTVSDAAMATTASPGEFTQVKLGPLDVPYVSAGLGFSNPAKEALDEADRIWQVSNIGCLVSIGTGIMPPARLESHWESMSFLNFLSLENIARVPELLTTFFKAATDCERVHEELSRDARLLNLKYFRFNVEDGLQEVGRNDVSKLDKIETATKIYLDRREVMNSLIFCASQILTGSCEILHKPMTSPTKVNQSRSQPRSDPVKTDQTSSVAAECKFSHEHQEESTVGIKVLPLRPRQRGSSKGSLSCEWNTSRLFDSKYADINAESSYASTAADDWFRKLKERVHTVLNRRPESGEEKVKIAILDTGIDASHPKFTGRVFNEKNCHDWTGSSGPIVDSVGHGTHAAALVHEIAPNALMYIGKVFDSHSGNAQTPTLVAKAIEYAVDVWDVNIISMSFGFARYDDHIRSAIEKAQNHGAIIFAAASNEGAVEGQEAAFPARMVGKVIKISSADGGGAASKFNPPPSSSNDNFSILGEAVKSAWPKALHPSGEKRGSGTSVATPIAAGTAALVLEFARQLSGPDELTPIAKSEILWRYYGMRAIFVLMSRASPKDGFNWIRPWALFANGSMTEQTEEISRQISYELKRV